MCAMQAWYHWEGSASLPNQLLITPGNAFATAGTRMHRLWRTLTHYSSCWQPTHSTGEWHLLVVLCMRPVQAAVLKLNIARTIDAQFCGHCTHAHVHLGRAVNYPQNESCPDGHILLLGHGTCGTNPTTMSHERSKMLIVLCVI